MDNPNTTPKVGKMKYLIGLISVPTLMLLTLYLNDNGYGWLALGIGLITIGGLGIYLALNEIRYRNR